MRAFEAMPTTVIGVKRVEKINTVVVSKIGGILKSE